MVVTSPVLRLKLAHARSIAITRDPAVAIQQLERLANDLEKPADQIAVALLRCEIHYLSQETDKALAVFDAQIEPSLASIDPETAVAIADNKSLLLFERLDPSGPDYHYHIVDQRRILGVELQDWAAQLDAKRAQQKGKDYEALPTYWQQLVRAYRLQNWRAMASTNADYAQECLRVGDDVSATYHAVLALDKEAIESVADELLCSNSSETLEASVRISLAVSQLVRYAAQTAHLLARIADAIPDRVLPEVVGFVKKWEGFCPKQVQSSSLLENLWLVLCGIAPRLGEEEASAFAAALMKHPVMQGGILRRKLLGALVTLCAQVSGDCRREIAECAIGLVTAQRNDIDFGEAVELLCHLAHRGGDILKAELKSRLFPPGTPLRDPLLIQLAAFLGARSMDDEQLATAVRTTAAAVRRQVERLGATEQPAKLGGITMTLSSGSEQVVVHVGGAQDRVDALLPYSDQISSELLAELVQALLASAANSDNIISNRVALVVSLGKLVGHFPADLDSTVMMVLEPLAAGDIQESFVAQTYEESTNPLNAFRIGGGNPADLRGVALQALAKLDAARPKAFARLHAELLLSAVTSPNSLVRQYGIAAAHACGQLDVLEQTEVAIAGLDTDDTAAQIALQALAESTGVLAHEQGVWLILVRCLEAAVQSRHPGRRRAGARLAGRALQEGVRPELRVRIETVIEAFRSDIFASVRSATKSQPNTASLPCRTVLGCGRDLGSHSRSVLQLRRRVWRKPQRVGLLRCRSLWGGAWGVGDVLKNERTETRGQKRENEGTGYIFASPCRG